MTLTHNGAYYCMMTRKALYLTIGLHFINDVPLLALIGGDESGAAFVVFCFGGERREREEKREMDNKYAVTARS